MKYIINNPKYLMLVITFLICTKFLTAQNDNINKIDLRIINVCQTANDIKKDGYGFILKLTNQSHQEIYIPSQLLISPLNARDALEYSAIEYQIFYCELSCQDTIEITNRVMIHQDGRANNKPDYSLENGKSVLIEGNITFLYFHKPGTYFVRFFFQRDKYKGLESIVSNTSKLFIN